MTEFRWPIRVYYEDTDLAGVVYYANYLRYMERARTEWLRDLGCELDWLRDDHGLVFVVVRANLEFLRPARFNDWLEVDVRMRDRGRASVVVEQTVFRDARARGRSAGRETVCRGEIRIACVDAESLHPRAFPPSVYVRLEATDA